MCRHKVVRITCILILIGTIIQLVACTPLPKETWSVVKLLTKEEGAESIPKAVEVRNCVSREIKEVSCSLGTTSSISIYLAGIGELTTGLSAGVKAEGTLGIEAGVGRELGTTHTSGAALTLDLPEQGFVRQYEYREDYSIVRGNATAKSSSGAEQTAEYLFRSGCDLTIVSKKDIPCDTQTAAQLPQPTDIELVVTPTDPTEVIVDVMQSPKVVPTQAIKPLVLKGHRTIPEYGTEKVVLNESEVIIGTADRFQDNLNDELNPRFTIFVIRGPLDADLQLWWGGWDIWENASPAHIRSELNKKVDEVKQSHPQDFAQRGYRVIDCLSGLGSCQTIDASDTEASQIVGESDCRLVEQQGFYPVEYRGQCITFVDSLGTSTTYTYKSIAVDDELERVEVSCPNFTWDVTSQFEKYRPENEILYHWRGSISDIGSECQVRFVVRDLLGDKIGLQFKTAP